MSRLFVSGRGFTLLQQEPCLIPVITLELYEKWYNVFVLHPDGTVLEVPPHLVMKANGSDCLWIGHEYHPELLQRLAEIYCGCTHAAALEMTAGRWIMSGHGNVEAEYYHDWNPNKPTYEAEVFKTSADQSKQIKVRTTEPGCLRLKLFTVTDTEFEKFNEHRHNWVHQHFND